MSFRNAKQPLKSYEKTWKNDYYLSVKMISISCVYFIGTVQKKKKLSPVRRYKPKKEGHPDQRTIFPNQYSQSDREKEVGKGILLKIRIIVKYTAFGYGFVRMTKRTYTAFLCCESLFFMRFKTFYNDVRRSL